MSGLACFLRRIIENTAPYLPTLPLEIVYFYEHLRSSS